MKINALSECFEDSDCQQYFTESKAKILGYVFDVLFDNYESQSVEDKTLNTESFEYMT